VSHPFFANLEEWVQMQKRMLEMFRKVFENCKEADRLELILATRAAFQHMIKTLKAFDDWLQDPMILSHMPKEFLDEVWKTAFNLLIDLIKLDIRHTSAMKEHIEKLYKEGKLSPLVWQRSREPRRRGMPSTT